MSFKPLRVYGIAFDLAMKIFETSKGFLKEEAYSLTDQIRRSFRSVCSNIAEAYRKRNYLDHFRIKLSDCYADNADTQSWLHFSGECRYISEENYENLNRQSEEVGKLINL